MASLATPYLESFFWHALDGVREIQIDEGSGFVPLVLTTRAPVSGAIFEWQTLANASPSLSGTYAFEQNTGGATFDRTDGGAGPSGPGTFDIELKASLPLALGFTSGSLSGAGIYSSDAQPKAQHVPFNIDYDAPIRDHEVARRLYRWGRVVSHRHNRSKLITIRIDLETDDADFLLSGPLFTSRFRAYPCNGEIAAEYPLANFRGYLDVDPYGFTTPPRSFGVGDGHTSIEILGIVQG